MATSRYSLAAGTDLSLAACCLGDLWLSWPAETRQTLAASLRAGSSIPREATLPSLVVGCDPGQLVDLAICEGLAGPCYERLGGLVPPGPSSRLAIEAQRDAVRHLVYLGLLGKFAAALDQADVSWVALKGPVLAELSYPRIPRGYTDIDLLIAPGQLREALDALATTGAVPDWPSITKGVKNQLSMTVHGLTMVDLHWHLTDVGSARVRWAIPTEDLLKRRQRARLKHVDAWTLDPSDFLAYLALHASLQATQQLGSLLDIERTVASCAPDWEVLVGRCRAWGVGQPVSVVLNRARRTLGAAVPAEVIKDLTRGRPWSAAGGLAQRISWRLPRNLTRRSRERRSGDTSFAPQSPESEEPLIRRSSRLRNSGSSSGPIGPDRSGLRPGPLAGWRSSASARNPSDGAMG